MNETLKIAGKNILKDLLSRCSDKQQLQFKRFYSHKNIDLSINDVVDKMDYTKIDWAITQVENTLIQKKDEDTKAN